MKVFLLTLLLSTSSALGDDLILNWVKIQPDHWLWLHRISRGDPKYTPKNYRVLNPNFQVGPFLNATDAYTKCGLLLGKYEGFVYTNYNENLVAKLSEENHERMLEIHKTIEAWRSGRFDEWHHGRTQERPAPEAPE
jgi:hypothetical protein